MKQELENTWVGKALNAEQLKEYAAFEHSLETEHSEEDKQAFERNWSALTQEINVNLQHDPRSEIGIKLGGRCMELVIQLYGKERVALRRAVWEQGFKAGHGEEEHGLSKQAVAWLDEAMKAYYMQHIYQLLAQVGVGNNDDVQQQWQELMEEKYADDAALKAELYDAIMDDDHVSAVAKEWLKSIQKNNEEGKMV